MRVWSNIDWWSTMSRSLQLASRIWYAERRIYSKEKRISCPGRNLRSVESSMRVKQAFLTHISLDLERCIHSDCYHRCSSHTPFASLNTLLELMLIWTEPKVDLEFLHVVIMCLERMSLRSAIRWTEEMVTVSTDLQTRVQDILEIRSWIGKITIEIDKIEISVTLKWWMMHRTMNSDFLFASTMDGKWILESTTLRKKPISSGTLDVWVILFEQNKLTSSIEVVDEPLHYLRVQEF